MLSKSKTEYLKNNGWSSSLFFDKATKIFTAIEENSIELDFGRSVLYLIKNKTKIKVYVHHNGRSKEYMTLTNSKGIELKTFHYTDNTDDIIKFILEQFKEA